MVGREWCRGEGVVKGEGVVERGGSSGGERVVTLVPHHRSCVLGPRRRSRMLGPRCRSRVLALVAVHVCWALVIICVCWCWALVRSSSVVLVRRLWSSGWLSLGLGGCGFLCVTVVHCPRGHRLLTRHCVLLSSSRVIDMSSCCGWWWAPVAVCAVLYCAPPIPAGILQNPQESSRIHRNPQECHRNLQESSGIHRNGTGIHRNKTGMELELTEMRLENQYIYIQLI